MTRNLDLGVNGSLQRDKSHKCVIMFSNSTGIATLPRQSTSNARTLPSTIHLVTSVSPPTLAMFRPVILVLAGELLASIILASKILEDDLFTIVILAGDLLAGKIAGTFFVVARTHAAANRARARGVNCSSYSSS